MLLIVLKLRNKMIATDQQLKDFLKKMSENKEIMDVFKRMNNK